MQFMRYFEPMLLKEVEKPFDDENFLYEIKFDGIRAIIHVNPKKIKIFSRNGTDLTNIFPELDEIRKLVKCDTIFDGEIVAFNGGNPSFSSLQKRNLLKNKFSIEKMMEQIPVVFVVFDVLYKKVPLIELTLTKRKEILDQFKENDYFVKTNYIVKDGKQLFKKVVSKNLEGIVAKRTNSQYFPNSRSSDWIKVKNFKSSTFIIGGYVDNEVKSSLLLGEYRDKKLYYVGKVSIERRTELYKSIKKSKKRKTSPFYNLNDTGNFYINPEISCQVCFMERTSSGNLRQPFLNKKED